MTLARILRPLAAALLVLCVLPTAASAQAGLFDSFYVFGDSLGDTGNVWRTSQVLRIDPAPPPSESPNLTYFEGRFSNGPVAFEYLWEQLSGKAPGTPGALVPYVTAPVLAPTGAVNFAFGGTGTPLLDRTPGGLVAPGLLGQVELFRFALRGRKPSKKALYAIVTGANDYPSQPGEPLTLTPVQVVGNIALAIRRLHALGARDVLLLTLPDLGKTPQALAQGPLAAAAATALTDTHNLLLGRAVASLRAELPSLRLRLFDVNVVFTDLRMQIATPAQPLLWALPALDTMLPPIDPITPVPMSACLFVAPALCQDVPPPFVAPDGTFLTPFPLLFWDIVHPTTAAHAVLADRLYVALGQ